jgi:hypothetical protein
MTCNCEFRDRKAYESQREWLKDCMCMNHWMLTDYYQDKVGLEKDILTNELLDLITLMPDSQTQEIIDYITELRKTRRKRDDNRANQTDV